MGIHSELLTLVFLLHEYYRCSLGASWSVITESRSNTGRVCHFVSWKHPLIESCFLLQPSWVVLSVQCGALLPYPFWGKGRKREHWRLMWELLGEKWVLWWIVLCPSVSWPMTKANGRVDTAAGSSYAVNTLGPGRWRRHAASSVLLWAKLFLQTPLFLLDWCWQRASHCIKYL